MAEEDEGAIGADWAMGAEGSKTGAELSESLQFLAAASLFLSKDFATKVPPQALIFLHVSASRSQESFCSHN